jgi:hypothetical protein
MWADEEFFLTSKELSHLFVCPSPPKGMHLAVPKDAKSDEWRLSVSGCFAGEKKIAFRSGTRVQLPCVQETLFELSPGPVSLLPLLLRLKLD